MSGYCADLGLLDFESELGAGGKKKKKKKFGSKLKKGLKKFGKGLAIASTGGLAAAAMTKGGKKLLKRATGSRLGKAVLKGAKAVGLKATAKVKASVRGKAAAPKLMKRPTIATPVCPPSPVRITKTAADCSSKSELANLVAAQLASELAPKLNTINAMLDKFDLQRTATYEHNKLMADDDFRREVLSRLAERAANGNGTCQRAIRVIMAGRAS